MSTAELTVFDRYPGLVVISSGISYDAAELGEHVELYQHLTLVNGFGGLLPEDVGEMRGAMPLTVPVGEQTLTYQVKVTELVLSHFLVTDIMLDGLHTMGEDVDYLFVRVKIDTVDGIPTVKAARVIVHQDVEFEQEDYKYIKKLLE
jgi:hypothetical protein